MSAWEPTEWIAAVGALAAWVAVGIYVALYLLARNQLAEAAQLRREQTRPYVVVDIPIDWILRITIENIGQTVARDVTFEFPIPLESTLSRPWAFEESSILRDGVKMIPPRKRARLVLDSAMSRFDPTCTLPKSYVVIVRYSADDGTPYVDTYTLDFGSFSHVVMDPKGLPDLVQEIGKLRDVMSKWTDGGRGLLVHGRNKDEMIREERQEMRREHPDMFPPSSEVELGESGT